MPSYMYPKNARKVISKIISLQLDIKKLPKKYINTMLEFGLHGNLPACMYKDAVSYDINNIRFLPYNCVMVKDLINVIKSSSVIDTRLHQSVLKHRRALIDYGDQDIITLMIINKLLSIDDISYILDKKIIHVTKILKIDPTVANSNMKLNKIELVDVITSIPKSSYTYLYNNMIIDLDTLLYLSDAFHIPPTHISLRSLRDINRIIELLKKYPNNNIIDYISDSIKSNSSFIHILHMIISNMFPAIIPSVNDFISTVVDKDRLINMYGIKCVAMFSYDINMIDLESLDDSDYIFIEKNISIYDVKCRDFANMIRDKVKREKNRILTTKCEDIIRYIKLFSKNRINDENNKVEEVLIHIDNVSKNNKLSLSDISSLMDQFRLNPCTIRNILLSSATIKSKLLALRTVKNWKCYSLTNVSMYKKIKGVIVMDMVDYISTNILKYHKQLYDKMSTFEYKRDIKSCKCSICSDSITHHIYETTSCINYKSTDNDLMIVLFNLTRYLMHGMIHPNLISVKGWGPLIGLLTGDIGINLKLYSTMNINGLRYGDITLSSYDMSNKLVSIINTPIYELIPFTTCCSLNEYYSKIVILINVILEYMISIILYRILIVKRFNNIKEFISKVVNTVLESSGIYFCQMRVHEQIELEIDELIINGSMPVQLMHLLLKVASIILEEIKEI
ncbi:hypothetical protein SPVwb_037 [Swinepox virus]|nr:hypothetical protein SPVwb_037 [Swinepox virus]